VNISINSIMVLTMALLCGAIDAGNILPPLWRIYVLQIAEFRGVQVQVPRASLTSLTLLALLWPLSLLPLIPLLSKLRDVTICYIFPVIP
jgi:hypothetical protein